jgi:hypothetical protein
MLRDNSIQKATNRILIDHIDLMTFDARAIRPRIARERIELVLTSIRHKDSCTLSEKGKAHGASKSTRAASY